MRKLCDEHEKQDTEKSLRLTVPSVYDKIKRSNSSLNRKSKKLLEESIERVIDVLMEDQDGSDDLQSIDGEFDGIELSPSGTSDAMNRSLVGMWAKSSLSNGKTKEQPLDLVEETKISQTRVKKRSSEGEPPANKRKKTATSVDRSPSTALRLTDLGGVDSVIGELRRCLGRPILFPSIYKTSGIKPPRGVLLHGPPGCGKTMIANVFAAELGVSFIPLSAPSIVSGMSGESEKALREHFEEAKRIAPCLIFLDEIDVITPKRENVQREAEKRIVGQLLTCMDDLDSEKIGGKPVMVVAATNRPDSLDSALRRGGRFDKEISMNMPSESAREQILRALTRKLSLCDNVDFKALARMTPGFVGADLSDLVSTAGDAAISRFFDSSTIGNSTMEVDDDPSISIEANGLRRDVKLSKESSAADCAVSVTHMDFVTSLPKIQPMAKREGFEMIPDTTWADVGALESVREQLRMTIIEPIRHPEMYARVGITAPTAALLWGPPGCGKTLLAKAVANEARANFISVKGPELLDKFVGESERAVRRVFERARATVPCLIFFDELDALAPKRSSSLSESSARVVNTLLTELSGLSKRQGIYVLGATNRPDTIDDALLRSGRLETLLFIDLPGPEERVEILKTLVRHIDMVFDDVMENVARECNGYSGADIESLVRIARHKAMRRGCFEAGDFVEAKRSITPTVEDPEKYRRLAKRWGPNRGGILQNFGNLTALGASDV